METTAINTPVRVLWNKGKFTGQKPPLKLKEIWVIRFACNFRRGQVISRFSTWPSTAS